MMVLWQSKFLQRPLFISLPPVQRFFHSIDQIHQFTLSLRWNQYRLQCQHCHQHDQWVSHGFIYKQLSIDRGEPVGKRIVCSNRYGRSGCGHTFRFYCSHRVPRLHYSVSVCIRFLIALLLDRLHSVHSAYCQVTGATDSRHAWRWLNKLQANLASFRTFLLTRTLPLKTTPQSSCTSPLFSSLIDLLSASKLSTGSTFQLKTQTPFL